MRKRTPMRPRQLDQDTLEVMAGAGTNFVRFGDMRCLNCGLRQPRASVCSGCGWVPGQAYQ